MIGAVDLAIRRAQHRLLDLQSADGHWVGELEADSTITSEYLLLRQLLGTPDPLLERKAVGYLRDRQAGDGSWNLYEAGPGDVSATIKAYLAMKLAGLSASDPAMARARDWVVDRGGLVRANVFTKITLALFGQYPWTGVPAMPVEIMLLPRWSYFNLAEISYWSRTVLVPLLVIMDRRPVHGLPPEQGLAELGRPDVADPTFARRGLVSWKNAFVAVDRGLKAWEGLGAPRPWRGRALQAAHDWLVRHLSAPGGLGAIYPAMANAVLALRLLGYPDDHVLVRGQLKELEALGVESRDRFHLQPCVSPVWDTALAMNALLASGASADHPALLRATDWLVDRQVLVAGDWAVKRPGLPPGGWAFQYDNPFYPDLDDTAVAVMALGQVRHPAARSVEAAIGRAVAWLRGMQARGDGGWASFDTDQTRMHLNHIPFADHGALLDPSTEDLTARCLECLARLGAARSDPAIRRGVAYLRRRQTPEGAWYGRWGVNYLYGTWSVLRALEAVGVGARDPMVERAVAWLEARQNGDGGWGESCDSYADPGLAGRGPSMPSQTAWALLGLLAAGRSDETVARGVRYLVATQRADGGWEDSHWNGTGFPRVFYLKYHLYAHYFPLWALGVWRQRHA
jgi:squalene-hopene/tetraprenyl-beta-curcumene cyclase